MGFKHIKTLEPDDNCVIFRGKLVIANKDKDVEVVALGGDGR